MLNVSRVVKNKRFTQPIIRHVRLEQINDFGEVETLSNKTIIDAVVMPSSPQDLMKLPEGTLYSSAITISSTCQFNTAVQNQQPDTIEYHKEHYIIQTTQDCDIFGYTRAVATLTDLQPQPVK